MIPECNDVITISYRVERKGGREREKYELI